MTFIVQFSPVLTSLLFAVFLFLCPLISRKISSRAAPYIAMVGLISAFALAWWLWPRLSEKNLATIVFDRVAVAGWMFLLLASLFAVFISIRERASGRFFTAEYYGFIMLAAFGLGVAIAAGDVMTLIMGIETAFVSSCALVSFRRSRSNSLESTMKFFVMGVFATGFLIMGAAFIFGSAGSLDLSLISVRAPEISQAGLRSIFMFGIAMALVGFGFMVTLVPFHAWVPDTYESAQVPISVFFATGFVCASFIAFMRFGLAITGSYDLRWHNALWILSLVTMLLGSLAAMRQDGLKRMLAYSAIAHSGLILIVFPSASLDPKGAMGALMLYIAAYVFMMAGAFAAAGAIGCSSEDVDINRLAGLSRRRPYMAASLSLFLISLAGIPPTLGFLGKYRLLTVAMKNGDVALAVAAALISVVSIYYYLRPVFVMYCHEVKEGQAEDGGRLSCHPAEMAVILIAAMAILVFGVFPQNLLAFIRASIP